ncbi:AAA family ATPase [Amycolatopsis sp. cmx-4-68]|uniref:AAA family ATPase n=1 Tax=Amycolatopsis sp. cmx-4-68 TaxID=2790938 RepID=UPI00397CC421
MRLQSLEVTDFGLYRGTQRFVFSSEPGVELLWGENGRGKTTFLNALRYALFGVVIGRNSARISLDTVGNRSDEDSSQIRPFKVILTFSHEGSVYKLTRAYSHRDETVSSSAFFERISLIRDGDVLGPEERQTALAQLLPEQIARFFLFDAELLQEYEQLLVPGSDAGEKLKSAIERILGLPILTSARDDVAALLNRARTAQAKAAQNDRATRDLGNDLQLATVALEQDKKNYLELNEQVDALQAEVNEQEKKLTTNARIQRLIATRNAKRDEVERLTKRRDELQEDLAAQAGEIWRAVVTPRVKAELEELDRIQDDLETRYRIALASGEVASAVSSGICPTCHQGLTSASRAELETNRSDEDPDALQAELLDIRNRRNALRAVGGDPALICRLEQAADQGRVDLSDAEGKLKELEAEIAEAPDGTAEAVARLVTEHADSVVVLSNARRRRDEVRISLKSRENAVANLSDKLAKTTANRSGREARRVDLLNRLHQLLETAVVEFRDRLRDRVQDEASEVFRVLAAETDFSSLRINSNYGLTILHADGTEVVNRSSGYEHIVAISLIAALQRCSPMNGPIITDSPFGRLDGTHKRHVLKALPSITDQVLLLVHGEELDRKNALDELGTMLVQEHHLRRVSGRHTEIQSGAGS